MTTLVIIGWVQTLIIFFLPPIFDSIWDFDYPSGGGAGGLILIPCFLFIMITVTLATYLFMRWRDLKALVIDCILLWIPAVFLRSLPTLAVIKCAFLIAPASLTVLAAMVLVQALGAGRYRVESHGIKEPPDI